MFSIHQALYWTLNELSVSSLISLQGMSSPLSCKCKCSHLRGLRACQVSHWIKPACVTPEPRLPVVLSVLTCYGQPGRTFSTRLFFPMPSVVSLILGIGICCLDHWAGLFHNSLSQFSSILHS